MVLFLVWPKSERDIGILIPILELVAKKYPVKIKSIFNSFIYIFLYRPKVVVVSNFAGSYVNHIVCKFSYLLGIKTVSLVSEGVVPVGFEEYLYWGLNKEKKLYVDKYLLWNHEMHEAFLKTNKENPSELVVVGATGFDRYFRKIDSKIDQELKSKIEKFEFVVTYANWCFDLYEESLYFEKNKKEIIDFFGLEQILSFRDDKVKLSNMLLKLIKENPNTLFILKYHPGNLEREKTELGIRFEGFPNVHIIESSVNIDIQSLIQVSDIWLAYESTTALEAWLMGKPTIFINPSGVNFKRSEIYKGTVVCEDYSQISGLFNEFFSNEKIKSFNELEDVRDVIIKKLIGYKDGKSAERAALEINNLIEDKTTKRKIDFFKLPFRQGMRITLKYYLSFFIKKFHYMNGPFEHMNRNEKK